MNDLTKKIYVLSLIQNKDLKELMVRWQHGEKTTIMPYYVKFKYHYIINDMRFKFSSILDSIFSNKVPKDNVRFVLDDRKLQAYDRLLKKYNDK